MGICVGCSRTLTLRCLNLNWVKIGCMYRSQKMPFSFFVTWVYLLFV